MRAKWTCRGHCGASCGLYDLAEPHHNAKTRVHLRFFNGLLGFAASGRHRDGQAGAGPGSDRDILT